jgi:hypothetical protein
MPAMPAAEVGMTYIKKRNIAIWITVGIICFSILFGTRSSLTELRQDALEIFYQGEKRDGKGIDSDLEYISAQCYNLTVVAGRYLDPADGNITGVLDYREKLSEADTPGSKFREKENLLQAALNLYDVLGGLELSEKDQYYRESVPVNIESRQRIISHSSYNQKAQRFNRSMEAFPANILGRMVLVKPLELYE